LTIYKKLKIMKNKNFSTVSGSREALLLVTIIPASLNKRSQGTEVAEIHKYFFANFDNIGKISFFLFHHSIGSSSTLAVGSK
jgi:hypothetical protein